MNFFTSRYKKLGHEFEFDELKLKQSIRLNTFIVWLYNESCTSNIISFCEDENSISLPLHICLSVSLSLS